MLLREEKIKEAEKLIDDFKAKFKECIGTNVIITYRVLDDNTKVDLPILSLEDLEDIINKFLKRENLDGLRNTYSRSRKWDYVKYKHVFCKLAWDMKYTTTSIGRYLQQNHATVISGRNKCLHLLQAQDREFSEIYNEIITYIKLIYEYDGNVQNNDQEQDNT